MIKDILIADLTHTARGLSSNTFPLGASYVAAYAKKQFKDKYNIKLFKLPEKLSEEIIKINDKIIIGCSCYAWNTEISYELCKWAKELNPNTIVIFGGPNFPHNPKDKKEFLEAHPLIDFYIHGEGEEGFTDLIEHLEKYNYNVHKLKDTKEPIINCNYIDNNGEIVSTQIKRIENLDTLESPYLSGFMDEFFSYKLIPLLETTRGCPFSCTYCTDGALYKNSIKRHTSEKIEKEIRYIAERSESNSFIITDLNFGMYNEDIETAEIISKIQKEKNWPLYVEGSPGKNRKDIIKKVIGILKGTISVGASLQTSDKEVLKNIKRSNVNIDTYKEYIDFSKRCNSIYTFTDIIFGLPGDTLEKHFESIKFGMNIGVDTIMLYQTMLLLGSELELDSTRKEFSINTRFRVIPGCIGEYTFGEKKVRVMEFDEIIVETNTLPIEDYINGRVMDLLVESYFNRSLSEELFKILSPEDIFNSLKYLYDNQEIFSDNIKHLINEFKERMMCDIYESKEQAIKYILNNDVFNEYIEGKRGINELLSYTFFLYNEMDDLIKALTVAIESIGKYSIDYLEDIGKFLLCRKKDFYKIGEPITEKFKYNVKKNILKPTIFRFYHTDSQKCYIKSSLDLWDKSSRGLPGMIQKSNIRMMYRNYEEL